MAYVRRKTVPCPTCDGMKDPRAVRCMACRDRLHYSDDANLTPRECTKCERMLPGKEFRLRKVSDRKGGGVRRDSVCLECYRADARRRARVRAEAGHPWTNPVYQLRHYARKIWRVDPEALIEFVEGHDGYCEICGRTAEEVHKDGRRLAVDHSDAGVRGMLCHHCNTGIGHFQDDPERLTRAIKYLSRRPALPRIADPDGGSDAIPA